MKFYLMHGRKQIGSSEKKVRLVQRTALGQSSQMELAAFQFDLPRYKCAVLRYTSSGHPVNSMVVLGCSLI
jgi:hypothetical protein